MTSGHTCSYSNENNFQESTCCYMAFECTETK